MEIWKDIKDYEGIYKVSNLGNVKSLRFGKEKILKISFNSVNGYNHVVLYKDKTPRMYSLHRLIYREFIGELIEGLVIDHINGIKTENNVENLQQISYRANTTKGERIKNGTSKYVGVIWHKGNKKWQAMIRIKKERKHLGYFHNEEEAAAAYQAELSKINF